jgi:hypothetical protein
MAALELVRIRRVLVGLSPDAAAPLLATAAEFARAFDAELHGLFIEDAVAFAAAALPLRRAIAPRDLVWRLLEPAQMTEVHELAARGIHRSVLREAAAAGVAAQFEVVRGDPARTLVARAQRSDLVVIAEPADPIARAVPPYPHLVQAALRAPAAVLYVPAAARRRTGPVIALVRAPGDPVLERAAQLAAALRERCVALPVQAMAATGDRASRRASPRSGPPPELPSGPIVNAMHSPGPAELAASGERLLVLSRSGGDGDTERYFRLAAERRVPMLLLER